MKTIKMKKYYTTGSPDKNPGMLRETLDEVIKKAENEVQCEKTQVRYIVKIIKVIRRYEPKPLFELLDVK